MELFEELLDVELDRFCEVHDYADFERAFLFFRDFPDYREDYGEKFDRAEKENDRELMREVVLGLIDSYWLDFLKENHPFCYALYRSADRIRKWNELSPAKRKRAVVKFLDFLAEGLNETFAPLGTVVKGTKKAGYYYLEVRNFTKSVVKIPLSLAKKGNLFDFLKVVFQYLETAEEKATESYDDPYFEGELSSELERAARCFQLIKGKAI